MTVTKTANFPTIYKYEGNDLTNAEIETVRNAVKNQIMNYGSLYAQISTLDYNESKNIHTIMLFAGNLIKHPCFNEMRETGKGYRVIGNLKNTDRIMKDTFWVGVYPGMTDEMIDYMAETIIQAVNG